MKTTMSLAALALVTAMGSFARAQSVAIPTPRTPPEAGPIDRGYQLLVLAPEVGTGDYVVEDPDTDTQYGTPIRIYDPNHDWIVAHVPPPSGYAYREARSVNRDCDTMVVAMRRIGASSPDDEVAVFETKNFTFVGRFPAPPGHALQDLHISEDCNRVVGLGEGPMGRPSVIDFPGGVWLMLHEPSELPAPTNVSALAVDDQGTAYLSFYAVGTGIYPDRILRAIDPSGAVVADQIYPATATPPSPHPIQETLLLPLYGSLLASVDNDHQSAMNVERYDTASLSLVGTTMLTLFDPATSYFMPGLHRDPAVQASVVTGHLDTILISRLDPSAALMHVYDDLLAPYTYPWAFGGPLTDVSLSTLAAPAQSDRYLFVAGSFTDGGWYEPYVAPEDWQFWSIYDRLADHFWLFKYRDEVPTWAEFVEDKRELFEEPDIPRELQP